ncbi:hypothetical protein [Lentibacillus jeotgali]|uniref:hypothetical protein n=1 Tax=Lentibacillus jeotgali TaxID=558169 RepID=UPI00110FC21D|nr:hypothetical protein [Lentibacillus jeotgali]
MKPNIIGFSPNLSLCDGGNPGYIAPQTAQQANAENVEISVPEGENSSSNIDNSFILKQEINNIRDAVETEVIQSKETNEINLKDYTSNQYQLNLYEIIKAGNYHNDIKENASVICLRAGSNCNDVMYGKALKAVAKVDKFLYLGGVAESVPALFKKMYHDRIKYSDYYKMTAPAPKRDTSFYYNWLDD